MPVVTKETATVYRGGDRRYFTRRSAYLGAAKAILMRRRCYCYRGSGEHDDPSEVCHYHYRDDVWLGTNGERTLFTRLAHRLAQYLRHLDAKELRHGS